MKDSWDDGEDWGDVDDTRVLPDAGKFDLKEAQIYAPPTHKWKWEWDFFGGKEFCINFTKDISWYKRFMTRLFFGSKWRKL